MYPNDEIHITVTFFLHQINRLDKLYDSTLTYGSFICSDVNH